jgi:hypothetical protein
VTLLRELVNGARRDAGWILNGGDVGLLRSLDRLTAASASAVPAAGGTSIAAHVDHVRYGLSLMNRWAHGEPDPWATADWTASWGRAEVTEEEWAERRAELAAEAHAWLEALATEREYADLELTGIAASIAHLAYHLGAIRQMDRSIRGPLESASGSG